MNTGAPNVDTQLEDDSAVCNFIKQTEDELQCMNPTGELVGTKEHHVTRSVRSPYPVSFKLRAVSYAKRYGNRPAARIFGPPVTEKTIRVWRSQEERLWEELRQKDWMAPKWPDLEDEIRQWVSEHRSLGIFVSSNTILSKARQIARERGHSDVLGFYRLIENVQKRTCLGLGQIGNMDEVSLTFDMLSNKALHIKGFKTVRVKTIGQKKAHYTVVLSCCADGTKLPPFLIFKRSTEPKVKLVHGVLIHIHPEGIVDEAGIKLWLDRVWSRRPGGLVRKPALLVWDQSAAHGTHCIKTKVAELKTQLAVVPNSLTNQLQPLDAFITEWFKEKMHEQWNKWMRTSLYNLTPVDKVKWPTISEVCKWVRNSWDAVKTDIIVDAFRKCGISSVCHRDEDSADSSDEDFLGFPSD